VILLRSHGDNHLRDRESLRLRLVIDWETAGTGEPEFDLRCLPGDCGIESFTTTVAQYERMSGTALDMDRIMAWHLRTVLVRQPYFVIWLRWPGTGQPPRDLESVDKPSDLAVAAGHSVGPGYAPVEAAARAPAGGRHRLVRRGCGRAQRGLRRPVAGLRGRAWLDDDLADW
jgi:hypothetical protein